jgi:hypothetical protein
MADVKAGRMDPKVAKTVAYVGTVLLRAYEADAAHRTDTPAQPCVPVIYHSSYVVLSLHRGNALLSKAHDRMESNEKRQ